MEIWNLTHSEHVEQKLLDAAVTFTNTGALAIDTGQFTGRSPKDKYVVYDDTTKDSVWWGDVNNRFEKEGFDALYNRVCAYLGGSEVYVRDSYACAESK